MDVNVERAEDVLTHKRILELAGDPVQRPSFALRAVQVLSKLFSSDSDILYVCSQGDELTRVLFILEDFAFRGYERRCWRDALTKLEGYNQI
ncbi:hypothetical protein ZWY2020_042892 [Hordeum vulgare]|nr:hypothetical protein ZWY2020_042892 [Hordeum vulgare]